MSTAKRAKNKDWQADLRALFAHARSKGFGVSNREKAYRFRAGLQRVMLDARLRAGEGDPAAFFTRLTVLGKSDLARFSSQPIDYDYLLQLLDADPLPIHKEVTWIAARLMFAEEALRRHVASLDALELHFRHENYGGCLQVLEESERHGGVSLWSTELRIGFTQFLYGRDAQKQLLADVRRRSRRGMWPYLAHHASVRAEPTVSISWFLEETKRRIERNKTYKYLDYLAYKTSGEWPQSLHACAKVLVHEQSHHVIDLYETFISFAQEMTSRELGAELMSSLSKAVHTLRGLGDPRIEKLSFALAGDGCEGFELRGTQLMDRLLSQEAQPLSAALIRHYRRGAATTEHLFAMAAAVSAGRVRPDRNPKASWKSTVVRGLALAIRREGRTSVPLVRGDDAFRKLTHVFSGLPQGKALGDLNKAFVAPRTQESIRLIQRAALNVTGVSFLDCIAFSRTSRYRELRQRFPDTCTKAFTDLLSGRESGGESLRESIAELAISLRYHLDGRPEQAVKSISLPLRSENRPIAAQAAALALNVMTRTEQVLEAAQLLAREHVEYGLDPVSMPIADIFHGLSWRDLSVAAGTPELSIALFLLPSSEGDDKVHTYRRFALEALLTHVGVEKPSELRLANTGWSGSTLTFFLDEVCSPSMLDMLPAVNSTRKVLEERREICGYLATINKRNSERHRQEVLEISRELKVLDGLQTIDGSRVHVDVESLSKVLKLDLAESFERYQSLIENQNGEIEQFSALLKDIVRPDQVPEHALTMPSSEPDDLLRSMIERARELFLFDVPRGLDSYVSKRIRHGSIVGVVRAPAEREGLAAKRRFNGSYSLDGTWAERILDNGQREALGAAIITTTRALDTYLMRLKDTLLHVKSSSKPYGLFEAPLSAPAYLLIRSYASSSTDLDDFVDALFSSLWGLLGNSLVAARTLLRNEAVAFASEQFLALRAKAQRILKDPQERAAFDSAAGAASVGVQSALETAATWFEPAQPASRSYSLQNVVDIAVESVRATTTDFWPDLSLESNAELEFTDFSLPLVCDILYIALGNVALHSGAGEHPKILVRVDSEAGSYLKFTVENEVRLSEARLRTVQDELTVIRREVEDSKGRTRARSEGGSGLHKLASMVLHQDSGTLEFDCDSERFRLCVRVTYSENAPF